MNSYLIKAKKILCFILISFCIFNIVLIVYGYVYVLVIELAALFLGVLWLISGCRIFLEYKIIIQKFLVYLFPKFSRKSYTKDFFQYIKTRKVVVYRQKYLADKLMAFNDKVLVYLDNSKKSIIIVNARFRFFRYKVRISELFGVIPDSKIEKILVLPYKRNLSAKCVADSYRIVVFTDKCQIYHNYPDRSPEFACKSLHSDLIRFDESVVWETDLCSSIENDNSSRHYHPLLNIDVNFKDKYCNGGFPVKYVEKGDDSYTTYKRFEFYKRSHDSNPFMFMGGMEYNKRICLIGTYRSNTIAPVRTCIFASSDGGRQWYTKYEFGDIGIYDFQQGVGKKYGENYGDIVNVNNFDLTDKIIISKRLFPHEYKCQMNGISDYDWSKPFSFEVISESNILRGNNALFFTNGNIVRILDNEQVADQLFKVEVLSREEIRLHVFVSKNGNLPCRHIHSINMAKDGFYITTGEIYPNGWVLFFEQNKRDNGFLVNASANYNIKLLNNHPNAAQRLMGIFDFDEYSVLFGSDYDVLMNRANCFDENITFQRNSLGIYKGKITDLSDFSKFECIKLVEEPIYFFKKINGYIFCVGQNGIFLCSCDNGRSWDERKLPTTIENNTGVAGDFILLGEYLVEMI